MKLGHRQKLFSSFVPLLLMRMITQGYTPKIAYVKRCQFCPVGAKNSLHKEKTAIDIDLFLDGKYLEDTESHRQFGEFWKSLSPRNRWGGDFRNGDGNHYETK